MQLVKKEAAKKATAKLEGEKPVISPISRKRAASPSIKSPKKVRRVVKSDPVGKEVIILAFRQYNYYILYALGLH